jgi:hypothetical protein
MTGPTKTPDEPSKPNGDGGGRGKPRSGGEHLTPEEAEHLDEALDEALDESFPASDPPAVR